MNNSPLVSTIIPVYNGEKYISRAVESALSQTYKNIEVIIIDDGSKDKTRQIISEFEKKDARIVILANSVNLGFVKTLNKGAAVAKGQFIARLDHDDFWTDPKKLEKQAKFFEDNQEYVLTGGGVIKTDVSGRELLRYLFPESNQDIRKAILIDNTFAHSSVLFRKNAFQEVGGYDEHFGFFADRDLWLKLGRIGKLHNFPEYFVCYLDKEESGFDYSSRNDHIRRKLKLNIELRKKYRKDYPGFYRSVLLCIARYFYSYLPYRKKLWRLVFRLRILFFGQPSYRYFRPDYKNENRY